MDGGQRGGGEEAEHAARPAQAVEALGDGGLAADDVGQAAAGEGHDEEADADPVVAAAVVGLAEQPEGADEQHERQQQGHPAEGAVDDAVDRVREPAPEAPPGEGGDEDAEREVEQGGAVAALLRGEVADVVADPADPGAHHVADAQPGAGHHPHQPGLLRLDGGQLPGARGSAADAPARLDLDAAEPEPRPAELPDLPLEFPLGAEEVRVAIPATVPEAGPETPDFRASGSMLDRTGSGLRPARRPAEDGLPVPRRPGAGQGPRVGAVAVRWPTPPGPPG